MILGRFPTSIDKPNVHNILAVTVTVTMGGGGVVDLTGGTHVCTFGLFNLSFDIFLFLVQIIYDFSGLFIREIFLIA